MPKDWPLANVKVAEAFKDQFSNFDVDVYNIEQIVLQRPDVLFLNGIATLLHYGIDILKNNKKYKHSFWRTPFIFKFVKRWIKNHAGWKPYCFTFQIQSIFDCSMEGVPHFVYTDHTHLASTAYDSFKKEKLYPAYWLALEQQIYDHATLNFVRSSNIKKSLEEQYCQSSEKVICVFAGSNVATAAPVQSAGRFEKQNVLFVGIDWERKGGPTLLSAFKSIRSAFPNATLTIVGCKPNFEEVNVKVIGKIPPEELKRYYRDASIFCMPTKEEPFGIVFLEAMQAGLPVIGTDLGAIPDFIQANKNGFLVQPNDIHGVAQALSKLLDDPVLCREFGNNSLKIIEENYTWSKVCEKFDIYISQFLER